MTHPVPFADHAPVLAGDNALPLAQHCQQEQIQDDATIIPDANDRASYESNLGFLLKRNGRERKLVARIEKSISEIDAKTYGFCRSCGSDIGLKRLEARPVANECLDCKSLAEDAEKV